MHISWTFSLINAYVRDIYPLLILSEKKNTFSPLLSIKEQNLWTKWYPWILQTPRSESSFYTEYLFLEFLSKISLSFLLKKYLLKYWRVSKFTKRDLLQVPVINHIGLLNIRHQPPWSRKMDQIIRVNKLTDYLRHKLCPELLEFLRTLSINY